MEKIKIKELLKRLFYFKDSEEEKRRKFALEKGNKLEGLLISLILKEPDATLITDFRRVVTSLELLRTPIWHEIDWSMVEFSISTLEDIYSIYSNKF